MKVNYFNKQYYIYYQIADTDSDRRIITFEGNIRTVDENDEKYDKYLKIPLKYLNDEKYKKFKVKTCDDVLKEYLKDYKKWIYSAKLNKFYSIDFTRGEVNAGQQTFFSLVKNYKQNEKITAKEYSWFEKCANNALYYLTKDNIELECTSYDRKMCYANILGSKIKIPIKKGKEYNLKRLPKIENMKYGFYRVKITSDDPEIYKCFVFSKANVYVDISLKFVLEHQKQFNIKIELIMDDKPNAYLYDDVDMVELDTMTSEWLAKATLLKEKYKSNPLMKFIASGTWGIIQQKRKLEYTIDEINENELDVGISDDCKYKIVERKQKKGIDYYVLVKTDNAYCYNIRLKPFVTAQARYDMGTIAIQFLPHVVRCQTDSISFNKPIEFNDPNYALEAKTTGLIHWKNVNSYHNKTTGYKSKNYDK